MNRQRAARLLSAVLVPLSLVLAGLGIAQADAVAVAFGVLAALCGGGLYWAFGRYGTPFEQFTGADVDFATTQTFFLGLLQLGIAVVEFALLMLAAVFAGVVTEAAVHASPQSVVLAFSGVVPAVSLGAGLPYLDQRFDAVARLNDTRTARTIGPLLTFGTYLFFVAYHPVAGVIYAISYVGSRATVLLALYAGPRLETAVS